MRACVAWLALAACNEVYSLDATKHVDARNFTIDAPRDDNDEDGDGKLNFEDNCPGVPNSSQANSDMDEVGDACDRTMNGGNDKIVARFMFSQPQFDREPWIGSGWEFRQGYIEWTDPDPTRSARMFTALRPEGRVVVVEARLIINSYDTTNESTTEIVIDGFAGPTCVVASNGLFAATSQGKNGGGNALPSTIPVTLISSYVRESSPASLSCRVGTISMDNTQSVPLAPDAVGLISRGNTVEVEYVVVYTGDL